MNLAIGMAVVGAAVGCSQRRGEFSRLVDEQDVVSQVAGDRVEPEPVTNEAAACAGGARRSATST